MGGEYQNPWRHSFASALEWWRDAGVETLVDDDPRDWLARPAVVHEPLVEGGKPAEPEPEPVFVLPDTLEEFVAWRMGPDAPEADGLNPRVSPRGPADAALMILTDMPEPGDADTLMADATGKLFDRMLAAIGHSRDTVYLTSLAWARPLTGQIAPEDEAKLIGYALHHIGLIAPQKLLLLGQTANRVLGAANGSAPGEGSHDINHFGGNTYSVATYHPRFLIERPAAKAEAWKHLQRLMQGSEK